MINSSATSPRVLVLGASSYLGFNFCRSYYRDYNLLAVSRSALVACPWRSIVDPLYISEDSFTAVSEFKPTHVISFIGLAHRRSSRLFDHDFLHVNCNLNVALFNALRLPSVRQFLYVSSAAVYGSNPSSSPTVSPLSELSYLRPDSNYSMSKVCAEYALTKLSTANNIPLVIFRPPVIYGKNCPGNFRILSAWASAGFPLPVALPLSFRSILSVENFSRAISAVINHSSLEEGVFNICEPLQLTTLDIYELICGIKGVPFRRWIFPRRLLVHPSLSRFNTSFILDSNKFNKTFPSFSCVSSKASIMSAFS